MFKQIFVRNHSSSCEIIHLKMGSPLCVHFHWDQTHFHLKGFARGLVLKQRYMVTTKNGISQHPQDGLRESRRDFTRAEPFCRSQLNCGHACCSRVQSFSDVKCFKRGFTKGAVVLGSPSRSVAISVRKNSTRFETPKTGSWSTNSNPSNFTIKFWRCNRPLFQNKQYRTRKTVAPTCPVFMSPHVPLCTLADLDALTYCSKHCTSKHCSIPV